MAQRPVHSVCEGVLAHQSEKLDSDGLEQDVRSHDSGAPWVGRAPGQATRGASTVSGLSLLSFQALTLLQDGCQ